MIGDPLRRFDHTPGAWMMEFEHGWYAYKDDEPKLGPFKDRRDAAIAAEAAGYLKPPSEKVSAAADPQLDSGIKPRRPVRRL